MLLAPLCAAHAQDAAQAGTSEPGTTQQLQQVIVTAQKRSEQLNQVPMAISAFRGEDLKAQGIQDTRDLGKLVPGFTAADSGFETPIYTLRGVGFADSSFAATSTVGLYQDEVALPYPVMSRGANLDLRRVEVLRGPQGTLYGRNATGGTINYISNAPTGRYTTGGDIAYGSYGRVDAESYISGPIGDTLKGRFAVHSTTSTEGWQISNTRPDDRLGKLNKQSARGIVDWQALDTFSTRLTVSGWRDYSDPQAPFAIALQPQNPFFGLAGLDPTVRNYPIIPNNQNARIADWNPAMDYGLKDNFWLASLRPSWDISDTLNLTGLLSFEQMRADGSKLPQSGLNVEDIDSIINAYIRTYSAELRLSGKIAQQSNWLIGLYGNYDRHHAVDMGLASENSLNILIFGDTPPLYKPIFFEKGGAKGDAQVRSQSAFADTDLALIDTLKLTLGVRYTQEHTDYNGCTFIAADNDSIIPFPYFTFASFLRGGNTVVHEGDCGSIGPDGKPGLYVDSLAENNVSYRSVLSWTPVDDALLYASYSRGYKSGSFPIIWSVDQTSLHPVVQEKLDSYKVGAKATTPDGRLHADLSAYYYQYTNKQLLTYFKDPVFGALQYLQNVPRSLDEGVELSTTWRPLHALFLSAAGSYIRTKVIEYQGLSSQGTPFDFAGQPFNYTPRLQGSLLANYTWTLHSGLKLSPGASFVYTGGTNATLEHDPLFALNAHRVYDAHLSLAESRHRWTLTAYARNLTNEFWRTSVNKSGDSVWAFAGQPRTYGVSFSWDLR